MLGRLRSGFQHGVVAAAIGLIVALPCSAQPNRESLYASARQRCALVAAELNRGVSAENARRLYDLRDCDQTAGPLIARLWSAPQSDTGLPDALIGASRNVRDARIADAAIAAAERTDASVPQRAAALIVLANYLYPEFAGRVERIGARTYAPYALMMGTPTWIVGSQDVSESQRLRIRALAKRLRQVEPAGPVWYIVEAIILLEK